MGRKKKYPSDSLRQQAYILRKEEGLNDEQIWQRFIDTGKVIDPKSSLEEQRKVLMVKGEKNTPKSKKAGSQDKAELPDYILQVMKIQDAFVTGGLRCSVTDAIALKSESDRINSVVEVPPWSRPHDQYGNAIMSKRQNEIMDAIAYAPQRVIMIEGSKRTGKSTSVFLGICESIWNGKYKRWKMWGSTLDNARDILRDIKYDPITVEFTKPLYKGSGSADKLLFFNNGHLEVKSTGSERRSSGIDADAIWIDESHSVLIENPKTFAMAVMILLAQPDLKVVFSMNREGAAYEFFKNSILDRVPPEDVMFFTLNREDVDHISDSNDALVRVLVEASAGEDYVAQYMDNKYIRDGTLVYPTEKVRKAGLPTDYPRLERYEVIGCGVDWGDTHDTAFHIGGLFEGEWFEIETIYIQHATSNQLERIFARIFRDYPGIIIVWEQSPLGGFIRNTMQKSFPKMRFINSNFTKHKENYIDNLYVYLVNEKIHLLDGKIIRQLRNYTGDKKNDDGHDALAHVIYKLAPRIILKGKIESVNRSMSVIN